MPKEKPTNRTIRARRVEDAKALRKADKAQKAALLQKSIAECVEMLGEVSHNVRVNNDAVTGMRNRLAVADIAIVRISEAMHELSRRLDTTRMAPRLSSFASLGITGADAAQAESLLKLIGECPLEVLSLDGGQTLSRILSAVRDDFNRIHDMITTHPASVTAMGAPPAQGSAEPTPTTGGPRRKKSPSRGERIEPEDDDEGP